MVLNKTQTRKKKKKIRKKKNKTRKEKKQSNLSPTLIKPCP